MHKKYVLSTILDICITTIVETIWLEFLHKILHILAYLAIYNMQRIALNINT